MALVTIAECDGPGCTESQKPDRDTSSSFRVQFPGAWTVISVVRSRIPRLGVKEYGFCSARCLYNWAEGFDGSH